MWRSSWTSSLLGASVLVCSVAASPGTGDCAAASSSSSSSSSSLSSAWTTPSPIFAPFTAALLQHVFGDASEEAPLSPPSPPPPPPAEASHAPLERRQNNNNENCPANYNPCSALAAGSVCCSAGTDCALDQAGQIACCPRGAVCTGTISVGTVSVTGSLTGAGNTLAGGFVAGGGGAIVAGTPTNSFFVPATPTLPTTSGLISQQAFTGANPNAYYGGFAALATPFVNEQACTSAYSSCQTEFARCTSALGAVPTNNLGGAGFNGVTVSAGGLPGIAVPGTSLSLGAGGVVASATSICQSISQQVCQNLQLSNCNAAATAVRSVAGAACPTPWSPAVYGVGVGVGLLLGVAEQVVVQ